MSPRGTVTNIALQSESLITSPWSLAGGASSAYGGSLPAGVGAMTTITENNTGLPTLSQGVASLPAFQGKTVIVSGYAIKVAGSGWLALSIDAGANLGWVNVGGGASGSPGGGAVVQVEQTNVANVYRWWYTVATSAISSIGTLRFYVVNGNGLVTHTLADAIAIGGVQIELAAPGQTTPSPYAPSGATAGVGRREFRQNLVPWSDDLTKSAWFLNLATVSDFRSLVLTNVNASVGYVQLTSGQVPGVTYAFAVTLAVASGTKQLRLSRTNNLGWAGIASSGIITVTTTPTRYVLLYTPAAGDTQSACFIGGTLTYAPDAGTILVSNVQVAQANAMPDFIGTRGAPANANGAPRSLVI